VGSNELHPESKTQYTTYSQKKTAEAGGLLFMLFLGVSS